MNEITDAINQYGVPTVTAVGMAYFIYYIWKFVTKNILPALGQASGTLIQLIETAVKDILLLLQMEH